MRELREWLSCALLVVLSVSVVVVVQRTLKLEVEAQRRLVDTSQNTNALLIQLGLTADELRRAAQTQTRYWDETGKKTAEIATELQGASTQLNKEILPRTEVLLADSDAELLGVGSRAQGVLLSSDKAIAELQDFSAQAVAVVSDPSLKQTETEFARAATATADSAENVRKATGDLAQAIHRETRPVSFAVKTAEFLIGNTANVMNAVFDALKY